MSENHSVFNKEYLGAAALAALTSWSMSYIYKLKDKEHIDVAVDMVVGGQPRYKFPTRKLIDWLETRAHYQKAKYEREKKIYFQILKGTDQLRRFYYG